MNIEFRIPMGTKNLDIGHSVFGILWFKTMRPLQNITQVVISSFRRRPESSGFKYFLDSPVKPGNDGKRTYSKVS
jgi:hypothetical protein